MERSIDSARSRRTNTPATPGIPATSMDAPISARPHGDATAHASNAMHAQSPRMPQPQSPSTNHAPRPVQQPGQSPLIGGNSAAARTPLTPVDPNQPARLKAKPKRFESTFAAQFAQNPQAEYRSQTG